MRKLPFPKRENPDQIRSTFASVSETFIENFQSENLKNMKPVRQIEFFAKIVDDFQPLTIFTKSSILDVRLGSENASAL